MLSFIAGLLIGLALWRFLHADHALRDVAARELGAQYREGLLTDREYGHKLRDLI